MADRPILFSAPMVRALLDGRKTQTRRLLSFPGIEKVVEFVPIGTDLRGRRVFEMKDKFGRNLTRPAGKNCVEHHFWPPVAVGDHLYGRETWRTELRNDSIKPRDLRVGVRVYYEAGGGGEEAIPECAGKLRPGMFMPRWASRITLIVTDLRVQRLQEISTDDCLAEGIEANSAGLVLVEGLPPMTAKAAYRALWDSLNASRGHGWEANPWVAAYTFTVHRGNIDQVTHGSRVGN